MTLALLLAYVDASDNELRDLNVTRDDVLRVARTFEAGMGKEREKLDSEWRVMMTAYRMGQMDGPHST